MADAAAEEKQSRSSSILKTKSVRISESPDKVIEESGKEEEGLPESLMGPSLQIITEDIDADD